jgi:serine/threonine-protein kinase
MPAGYDASELWPGQRLLDRYTILDRAGRGGMATIYRATDERLDRVVCVKLLRTVVDAGSGGAMYEATYSHFLQEAVALSKLQHPNTLKIYDFGYIEVEGGAQAPFQISEYLDGGDLEQQVRTRGALPLGEILAILDPVGSALAEAHERGIVHRDVKPSNILFARVGSDLIPKLADFGIARSELHKKEGEGEETASAITLFSPRWAAPEQLTGMVEGPAADVYALALVTAFMATGTLPFGDATVRDTFRDRVQSSDFVRARLRRIGVPPELEAVLALALATDPARRLRTPPDLTARLREVHDRGRRGAGSAPASSERARAGGAPPPPPPRPPAAPAGTAGPQRARYLDVQDKADLSFAGPNGEEVRFRVSILPGGESLNLKGLSCFVRTSAPGARPTPAITAREDGKAAFVSAGRQDLGDIAWSFGRKSEKGRVFVVDGADVLVPYAEVLHAVLLSLGGGRDVVILCKRS